MNGEMEAATQHQGGILINFQCWRLTLHYSDQVSHWQYLLLCDTFPYIKKKSTVWISLKNFPQSPSKYLYVRQNNDSL